MYILAEEYINPHSALSMIIQFHILMQLKREMT